MMAAASVTVPATAAMAATTRIVAFEPQHLAALELQSWQRMDCDSLRRPGYAEAIAQLGDAFTILGDGVPVACLGVVPMTDHRGQGWALISEAWKPHMLTVTRAAIGWLQQTRYRRVDVVVSAGFEAGHRWARLLGFQQEGGPREAYMLDGSAGITYAKVKPCPESPTCN